VEVNAGISLAGQVLRKSRPPAKEVPSVTGGVVTATATAIADVGRDPEFAKVHARLIADKSTQFDLPKFMPPELPSWIKPTGEFFKWLMPAFPYIFWGAVALIVGLIAWFIINESRGMAFRWPWQKNADVEVEPEWAPEQSAARALLSETEALAADGRYAEAARLLLRRSVEDIARRRPEFLKPSITARDISVADAIPGGARKAFAAIARVVEVSTFGSASVSAEAWTQCREAYGEFALAGSWRG
jgi:hypothetical protein